MAILDQLLKQAVIREASDVHLAPGNRAMVRINTKLTALNDIVLSATDTENMALRILGNDGFAQLQEIGEIDTSYRMPGVANFRVNVYRYQGMIGIAARVIKTIIPDLEYLGLPPVVGSLARYPSGLILVTGPTGSGKSTTLAAMIDIINRERSCHIITLEDPIEYIHQSKMSLITQREIGSDSDDFTRALRASLRQDPDVIMIGEMRDLETISTAITAAETGHLVLATLHTINSAQTVERIVDVFPSYQQAQIRLQLANCLRAVLSQRLLPRSDDERMVVAVELMICTAGIRSLIRDGKYHQIPNAIYTGSKYGMITMENSLQMLMDKKLIQSDFLARESMELPDLEMLAHNIPVPRKTRAKQA